MGTLGKCIGINFCRGNLSLDPTKEVIQAKRIAEIERYAVNYKHYLFFLKLVVLKVSFCCAADSLDKVSRQMRDWQYKARNISIQFAHFEQFQKKATTGEAYQWDRSRIIDYVKVDRNLRYVDQTCVLNGIPYRGLPPLVDCRGNCLTKYWPESRLASKDIAKDENHYVASYKWNNEYLDNLGFWLPKSIKTAPSDFYLPEAFESNEYFVHDSFESVSGIDCCVVESPNKDKIWLDPGRGYVPIKREWSPSQGISALRHVVHFDDYRQVDGIWLPFYCLRETYAFAAQNQDFVNTLVSHTIVKKIDFSATLNELAFAPGTLVRTSDNRSGDRRVELVGGGKDYLTAISRQYRIAPSSNGLLPLHIATVIGWILVIAAGCADLVVWRSSSDRSILWRS